MPNLPATKGNLLALRKSRALAQNGYDLLDRKQTILMREMMRMAGAADALRGKIEKTFLTAYEALADANIAGGLAENIAGIMPVEQGLNLTFRSVMGVELPTLSLAAQPPKAPQYSLRGTTKALDIAVLRFNEVKKMCAELAEIENTVYRLSLDIKKTRKRARALQNIVLPRFAAQISAIVAALEEKDREDFARLKAGVARA